MVSDAKRITRHLRKYDKDLIARVETDKICIFQKRKRFVEYDFEGMRLFYLTPYYDYVFSLTDNWALSGNSVPWGIEVILARLRAIDLLQDPKFLEAIENDNQKVDERDARRRRNNAEAFARDMRRSFAKAFDGINTSTLEKTDRRRIDERKIKHGYC